MSGIRIVLSQKVRVRTFVAKELKNFSHSLAQIADTDMKASCDAFPSNLIINLLSEC